MLTKIIITLVILLVATAAGVYLAYSPLDSFTALNNASLFDNSTACWALVGVATAGLILGAARAFLKKKSEIQRDVVTRHGIGSFISHWFTAFGIFAAIASGIIMGMYFGFWAIGPFASTSGTVISPLNLHYFAVALTLFGAFFFVGDYIFSRNLTLLIPNLQDITKGFIGKYFLRRPWTREDKYLSSQKSAFVPYILIGLVVLVTGAVKVAAHIWPLKASIWGWATIAHDWFAAFTILYTIVHVALVVFLGHWPAFWSWFTGTMKTHEVEHEHAVWYEDLQTGTNKN
ncbi:MAG: cytochrome b/b6 domain-containing protein [Dehalococcoidia bacterium]|nr:cytochrome b/b6 domain-containing protein [Dehalococcoidia bacterium]